MSNEASSNVQIRADLEAAGYQLIQFEPRLEGTSKYRPDVLALATNSDANLVPWLVVEVKRGSTTRPELALPALMQARELLGTVEHYAVINGQWFRADRTLRTFEPVPGPQPPTNGSNGFLTDATLATSLLMDKLWFEADRARASGEQVDFSPSVDPKAERLQPGIQTARGDFVPVRPDVLWRARRNALAEFTSKSRYGSMQASDPVISQAVALLLGSGIGDTVLDPFCGTGSFLWAAMDRAATVKQPTEFVGWEIDVNLAELAAEIAHTGPMLAHVESGDSLYGKLPQADTVVTAPPLGGRLQAPWQLLDGSSTMELEVAAVDLSLRHLRLGGRAVFHISGGFTFRQSTEAYRHFLAEQFRVAALIGLPSGATPGTSIRSVLLVIDRAAPGQTLVAQLGEDWHTQLSAEGALMRAALQHIDGHERT